MPGVPPCLARRRCLGLQVARTTLIVVAVVSTLRPAIAADSCWAGRDADARYEHIFAALAGGKPAARIWWIGWSTAYSAATVAQGVLAIATHDRGTRIDSLVGAAEAATGVIGMLVAAPRTPTWASDELLAMDAGTACARARRLRRAEELLHKSADEERQARAWYAQLLGDVINLAGPVVLWVGYGRHAAGWYTLGPGLAVQEAQILTQPTAAIEAWRSYERLVGKGTRPSWTVTLVPGGAALAGAF